MADEAQSRRLLSLLRALTVELDLVGADFARANRLHPTDVRALIVLVEAGREGRVVTSGCLAKQLGLDASSVTALVDRLERRGHLSRKRDPADGRRVLLILEDQAEALGWSFFGPLLREARASMQLFDSSELESVERFLGAMTRIASQSRQKEERFSTDSFRALDSET